MPAAAGRGDSQPWILLSLTEDRNVLPALSLSGGSSRVCRVPLSLRWGNVLGKCSPPSAPQQEAQSPGKCLFPSSASCSRAPCPAGLHHGSPGLISRDHLVSVPQSGAGTRG